MAMNRIPPIPALYLLCLPLLWNTLARLGHVWFGAGGDLRYLHHPWLTTLHLLPALLFLLLGPLQFLPRKRGAHRWRGRLFVLSGLVSGAGVLPLLRALPGLGGPLVHLGTVGLVLAFLASLVIGAVAARRRAFGLHRAAMMIALALGLSVASARWFILAGMAMGMPLERVFVPGSVLGATVNGVVVAGLLWWPRRRARGA